MRRSTALAAALLVGTGVILMAPVPAYADTSSNLCTNTTYVDGTNTTTKKKNFGTATDLVMAGSTKIAYLECVVSGIPAGATITGATLNVFARSVTTAHTINLRTVTSAWSETGLTWNTPAPAYSAPISSAPGDTQPGAGEWVNLAAPNVTGNGTWRFATTVSTTTDQAYASDDYTTDTTRRPKLTVTYTTAPVAPTAAFTAAPTSGTAPLAVQFTDTSTGGPTAWAWDFGDGGTSTTQNPSHTYAAAGTYTAALTASNAGGSTQANQTITVTETPSSPVPTVPAGTSVPTTLAFSDDFNGTSLDGGKWTNTWFNGGTMNNVPTRDYNTSVSSGLLHLQLKTETDGTVTGALVHSDYSTGRYQLPVGGFTEARVYFPGDGTQEAFNFPAWWISGPSWPNAGEHDIAEGLGGDLTVNYHSPTVNTGSTPAGAWGNAFHIFGVHRKAGSSDFYWDGVKVWTIATADNGQPEELIFNVGKSNSRTPVTGTAGEVQVDWVRAWQ